jgi:hypothetical protein
VRQDRKELDLADADNFEDDIYPGLADITLNSVPGVRNLISDLAMDVLLYQSAYCEHISTIVKQESNRILEIFKKRNPSFRGSVSLCGHSLGSAILFDILCREKSGTSPYEPSNSLGQTGMSPESLGDRQLDFDCKELFCLGSPIALFQMLKGKTIAGRSMSDGKAHKIPVGSTSTISSDNSSHASAGVAFNDDHAHASSPKCEQLYNIFHPSDPVSYRIEPLISPAMSSLRPQPLPSVKKSLWTASGQSLSIIGSRVGQSMGSLWSNFTSGVASSLLNRSLGLNSEDIPPQSSSNSATQSQPLLTTGTESMHRLHGRHPTLIDSDLETLYEGFQKANGSRRKDASDSANGDAREHQENEERMKKIRVEDAKVRSLNSNGRVDYSIQE